MQVQIQMEWFGSAYCDPL